MTELHTERLHLRQWRETDKAPFAALNADPEVMRHFPAPLTRAQSDAMVDRADERWREDALGWFAVDGPQGFIGFVGLARPHFEAPFMPCNEIGWRLARPAWGKGYASEAAAACLHWAFTARALVEIVSFTATSNLRSQAVMARIGMTRDLTSDFDHPALPEGHALRRHVLYCLAKSDWETNHDTTGHSKL